MSIDTSDLDKFAARLEKFLPLLSAEMQTAMGKSLDIFHQTVATRTPVNTGALRGSLSKNVSGQGVNLLGELVTPLQYGLPVETGRAPGKMPPVDAIRMWVVRKGIANGPAADSTAYLIARAIGRRGTKGAYMFRDGFDAGKGAVLRVWQDVPAKALGKL